MIPPWLKIPLVCLFALLTGGMAYLWAIGTFAMVSAGAWGEAALFTCCSGWLTVEFAVELAVILCWNRRR